jgi:uncharacterized protein with ParB-like and HNH nuclease domain
MSRARDIFAENTVKELLELVQIGKGLIIPEYQRPYRWSVENIERLMGDLIDGIKDIFHNKMTSTDNDNTLFLGTLLVVQTPNMDLARYTDSSRYVRPAGINYIVDGQQRLSTLAMLSIVLHRKIVHTLSQIGSDNSLDKKNYDRMKNIIDRIVCGKLKKFYCVTIEGDFSPNDKPIIIRQGEEFWTRDGISEYTSPIAKFISDYISTEKETDYSAHGEKYAVIQTNQKKISQLVDDYLSNDELSSLDPGKLLKESDCLKIIALELFQPTHHPDISLLINTDNLQSKKMYADLLKMCLLSLFLFENCCVNYLEPRTHKWAIEVFQSLNSTGVPLTAMEVFKAYVYQNRENTPPNIQHVANEAFASVESLVVENENPSNQTNVFLTAFALGFDGEKLGTQYKKQENYLKQSYDRTNKSSVFEYMVHLSEYMRFRNQPDSNFKISSQADLCQLFLDSMNLNTVHPLLAYYFDDDNHSDTNYLGACCATAAFYAIWRGVKTSSGLDNVARDLMKDGIIISNTPVSMMYKDKVRIISLREYKNALIDVLKRQNIWDKGIWVNNAKNFLTYQNSTTLCRFILFITAHNTLADINNPGSIQAGAERLHPFIIGDNWRSDMYKTVEHIAPQTPDSQDISWNLDIYGEGLKPSIHHSIGNLTLLPKSMNSILSNLSWGYKHQFYSHLANPSDSKRRQELLNLTGIRYTKTARQILTNTDQYFHYLDPIVRVPSSDGAWSRAIVEKRTEQICSLAYDRLTKWLEE